MTLFEKDAALVESILGKAKITHADRLQLAALIPVKFHDSGKIEGLFSIDSSCNACEFCKLMHEKGQDDPRIICGSCYDFQQEAYRKNVALRHGLTARILSSVEFTMSELKTLSCNGIIRFNSSGEPVNDIHLENYVKIAKSHPHATFALWTKQGALLDRVLDRTGKPRNLVIAQSSPIIGKPCSPSKYADIVFTVYVDGEAVAKAVAEGAFPCNGNKCKACSFSCYLKFRRTATGPVYVAEKLKAGAAKIALIKSLS